MKVVILAGGLGSRISEESSLRPKPMIEIGGRPILWHIMKIYLIIGDPQPESQASTPRKE
jgi:glucose-1-phosphate cytidylyltransferase